MLYDFTCMRDLEQSDSETESGMDGGRQGLGKKQTGTSCLGGAGTELRFCRTQGVLELEGAVVAQLCEVT